MLSSSTYALLRIAGWSYLPDFLTRHLLHILHNLPFLPHPPPPPNTPLHTLHHRLLFSLIVLLFLIYNLVEASRAMPPNFYEILGVSPGVDEGGLKVAFRAFARRYHPDKRGGWGAGDGAGGGDRGEEAFREVREVFEALRDPVVRFAYDRFGADVLTWTQCTTTREYLRHGLMQSSGLYIVTGAGLLFFSAIGKPSSVAFWRYLLFAALFASELSLLLSPSPSQSTNYTSPIHPPPPNPSPLLSILFPHRVAYQHILFLHQLFMFLSIALSRVVPVLGPVVWEWWGVGGGVSVGGEVGAGVGGEGMGGVVERFAALVRAADRELYLMLHTELHSVQPPPKDPSLHSHSHSHPHSSLKPITAPSQTVIDTLTHEMQNMIIENKLRKEAPLRSFWEAAVERGLVRQRERAVSVLGNGTVGGMGEGLPSPVSPGVEKPRGVSFGGGELGLEMGVRVGRLPSPRPSPPPPPGIVRRGSSYVRARSMSC